MGRRLLEYIPELELPDIDGARPAAESEDDVLDDEAEMALAAISPPPPRAPAQGSIQGRWQRQGNHIIVVDC